MFLHWIVFSCPTAQDRAAGCVLVSADNWLVSGTASDVKLFDVSRIGIDTLCFTIVIELAVP